MREGRIEDPNIANEMAKEENKGRNKDPRGPIGRKVASIKEGVFGNKKLEESQRNAEKVGEELERQKEIIHSVLLRLEEAARANKNYNLLHDKANKKLGRIKVETKNNGSSILVSFGDASSRFGNVNIMQLSFDFNNPEKELILTKMPYGPAEEFSLKDLGNATNAAEQLVRDYKLYPDDGEK